MRTFISFVQACGDGVSGGLTTLDWRRHGSSHRTDARRALRAREYVSDAGICRWISHPPGILGKGNASFPAPLREQIEAGAIA